MDPDKYFLNRNKKTDLEPQIVDNKLNSSRVIKHDLPTQRTDNEILFLVDNKKPQNNDIIDTTTENQQKDLSRPIEELENISKKTTYSDYIRLNHKFAQYDKRSLNQYFFDDLIQNHSLIKLIFKHSILDPNWLSTAKLFFRLNIIFAINAFALSNSLIEERASNPSRVSKL
jgi:hypothetical protein